MSDLVKIWKWGIVLPVTLAAFAGAIADIVTGTVDYWYLLAPSYFVIAVASWRNSDMRLIDRWRAEKARFTKKEADEYVEEMNRPARTAPGRAVQSVWQLSMRFLASFRMTFFFMVCMWGAIEFLTWAKPYWYIYVPVILVIAGLIWWAYASSPKVPAEHGHHKPHHDPLVR
ncbi:MAG TPA: hypothetical protein VGI95_20785 [Caulobacteraceae bacterium]